ncbi:MAG: hypothetical protein M1375_01765 [Candidatus Thermoplasmatota archaeon]|jgi:CRISPR/Cas system-associated exonuclease Cas4 (RecB family)|nr:hypothetical protein [Candidatus Thermoplasmatota archaeon]MCL5790684.1 hypothetical protein [Candidatus Thermoplasmatota archaeon]
MTEYGSEKPTGSKRIVSASELAEYEFCNVSWYFTRNGYERSQRSIQRLNAGTEMHRAYDQRYSSEKKRSMSLVVAIIVVVLLMLIIFL